MIPHRNISNLTKKESTALKEPNEIENNSSKDIKSQSSFNPDIEEVKYPNIEVRSKGKTRRSPGIDWKWITYSFLMMPRIF